MTMSSPKLRSVCRSENPSMADDLFAPREDALYLDLDSAVGRLGESICDHVIAEAELPPTQCTDEDVSITS